MPQPPLTPTLSPPTAASLLPTGSLPRARHPHGVNTKDTSVDLHSLQRTPLRVCTAFASADPRLLEASPLPRTPLSCCPSVASGSSSLPPGGCSRTTAHAPRSSLTVEQLRGCAYESKHLPRSLLGADTRAAAQLPPGQSTEPGGLLRSPTPSSPLHCRPLSRN